MSQPYIGQLLYVGFNFAPVNWAMCNGQNVPITQNDALFNLVGTTYGGDGINNFSYPNMQSRIPIHQGQGLGLSAYVLGQIAGQETVTLTQSQMPSHTHALAAATNAATAQAPAANAWLATGADGSGETPAQTPKIYIPSSAVTTTVNMAAATIGNSGGGQPLSIIQPYLAVNCIISLFGVFPSQT